MPNIDISRHANDPRMHYAGVRMQQGRVLTDDDFNESERIDSEDARRVRSDVIGPAGSPDNGFQLFVDAGQLKMRAGTYYVGGLRLELENDEFFNLQKDWLQQGSAPGEALSAPPAGGGERFDFIWLDVWQQPVTGTEDNEMLEAALGGADSSARIRTMRRARALANVGNVDCGAAWTQLLTSLATKGTVNADFELVPNAKLKIEPDGTAATADLCSPPVAGGYLGAENQAIRVQITGNNQFTWGFDNGAPVYRVKLLPDSTGVKRRIQMLNVPKDQAHYILEGQVVELLPWSALLQNGQKNGEQSGFLAKVNGGFNPDTKELFIAPPAPPNDTGTPPQPFGERWKLRADAAAIKNEDPPNDEYFYMRVWNRGADLSSPAVINFVPGTPVSLAKTGLQITFTGPNLRKEDFWIIAARPETPNVFVPWELSDGRAPHGVRHWIAPLGVIQWVAGGGLKVIDDCRPTFLPLTRMKGCCTYTVGDGTKSFGNFNKIQTAVDALPPDGGKICVLAGTYNESVVIEKRVAITIHGCGPRSRVQAVIRDDQDAPAFLISNSTEIELSDMAIESGSRSAVEIQNSRHVTVRRCLIQMRDRPTVWQAIFSRGDDILIDSNIIEVLPREGGPPKPKVPPLPGETGAPITVNTPPDPINVGFATRGGIQLGGGSDRVKIVNNIIRGGTWNGITLGSLKEVGSNDPKDIPDKPDSKDPCDPCKPPDLTDPPDPQGRPRFVSAGDLYDIKIIGNRITDMGINGIGVVRFFDITKGGDMIGVHGLHITDNYITRCMRRILGQITTPSMLLLVAYGGIALAKVTDLRVLRNEIVNNGTSHLEPICGVFAIVVEGLQLDDNRITNNGPKTEALATNAMAGIRGGVHIWLILPVIEIVTSEHAFANISKRAIRNGLPACAIRDNIIVAPLGRALTFFALGQVVVARNRLVTRGCTTKGIDLIAATVLIGDFGISNELTEGLLGVLTALGTGKLAGMSQDEICLLAKGSGLVNPNQSFWPPLVREWATGKVLITENQITLDLMDEPLGGGVSSIFAFSLDDIGFVDNQAELSSTNVFYYANAVLIAGSVREADNRFAETWLHAGFSAFSLGGMNTTTDNQATHCLQAEATLPGMRVFRDNLSLITVFCPRECRAG